jgi:uncharacterized protein YbjT (DUF2867 family)
MAGALERIAKHARRTVFLTAPLKTPPPFFQQPNPPRSVAERIERLIETSAMEWTFLRAGMFAGNARPFCGPHIRAGAYSAYARGTESLTDAYRPFDMTPYGGQQDFEDSPSGWPQKPTYGP